MPLQKPAPAGTHARSRFGSFAPPAPPAHRWATAKIWARHQIHKCAWVDVHDAQDQLLWYNPGNPWKLQKNDIRIFVQNLIPTNFHKTRCFLLPGWVWKRFPWEFFKKVETAIPCYIFLLQWDPGRQRLKSLHASWTQKAQNHLQASWSPMLPKIFGALQTWLHWKKGPNFDQVLEVRGTSSRSLVAVNLTQQKQVKNTDFVEV